MQSFIAAYREQMNSIINNEVTEYMKTQPSPDPTRWQSGYSFAADMRNCFLSEAQKGNFAQSKQYLNSHRGWLIDYGKRWFAQKYCHIIDSEKLFIEITQDNLLNLFKLSNLSLDMHTTCGKNLKLISRYDKSVMGMNQPGKSTFSPCEFYAIRSFGLSKEEIEKLFEIKSNHNGFLVFTGRDNVGNIIIETIDNANKRFLFDCTLPIN